MGTFKHYEYSSMVEEPNFDSVPDSYEMWLCAFFRALDAMNRLVESGSPMDRHSAATFAMGYTIPEALNDLHYALMAVEFNAGLAGPERMADVNAWYGIINAWYSWLRQYQIDLMHELMRVERAHEGEQMAQLVERFVTPSY